MRISILMLLIWVIVLSSVALAQDNPLITHSKKVNSGVRDILLRSAEKMPEENYNFKPTDAVRSYGQIIGHVVESQYYFCSLALGEKAPELNIEKKTAKADLIAVLKDVFAYCDKAYNSMNSTTSTQMVKLFGDDTPKLGALNTNSLHMIEHYGNLVTYMRMKNIVPPTSEPKPQPGAKQ